MPRANRCFLPGHIWHITHRCHKKDFLLKFAQTRQRYTYWLLQARRRFDVEILNYTITSNHVHLIVRGGGGSQGIPGLMQLVAGRTGQEYNARKQRKGAFWEDRYHATAIETGSYLHRCLLYVDFNMVRAGVVKHPQEWVHGGYHEIQGRKRRNTIINLPALMEALDIDSVEALRTAHREWVAEALREEVLARRGLWSESVAVGSEVFTLATQAALGVKGRRREVVTGDDVWVLREEEAGYGADFWGKNRPIAQNNAYLLDVSSVTTEG
jgi:putative transposase